MKVDNGTEEISYHQEEIGALNQTKMYSFT